MGVSKGEEAYEEMYVEGRDGLKKECRGDVERGSREKVEENCIE